MRTISEICESLNILEKDILNVYKYGSKVYENDTLESDDDFIIVFKAGLLPDGGFKANAKSSEDKKIQGIFYSRTGFQDAIDNYEINALECMFLKEDEILLKKFNYSIRRFYFSEFVKKIITKISASEYIAKQQIKYGDLDSAVKGVYHSLRILMFALQIKQFNKIIDFSVSNDLKKELFNSINYEKGCIDNLDIYTTLRKTFVDLLKK